MALIGGRPRVEWEHKVVSERVDLERGLTRPAAFDWIPKPYVIDVEARGLVARDVPVDGSEIVGWMHDCAAANVVLFGVMEEYDRLRSKLLATSGDPYIPGTALSSDFKFRSQRGSAVGAQGYGVVMTPIGTFNVPKNGCITIAKGKFLGWAAATALRAIQWKGTLMNWAELASKPVTGRVRCANIDGLVAPQFFYIAAPLALPVNTTTVKLTSDKPQAVILRGRSPADYGVTTFEMKPSIPPGESSITYRVFGLPRTTTHMLEIQPGHGTATIVDSVT